MFMSMRHGWAYGVRIHKKSKTFNDYFPHVLSVQAIGISRIRTILWGPQKLRFLLSILRNAAGFPNINEMINQPIIIASNPNQSSSHPIQIKHSNAIFLILSFSSLLVGSTKSLHLYWKHHAGKKIVSRAGLYRI
jgi:hypothetical protein